MHTIPATHNSEGAPVAADVAILDFKNRTICVVRLIHNIDIIQVTVATKCSTSGHPKNYYVDVILFEQQSVALETTKTDSPHQVHL